MENYSSVFGYFPVRNLHLSNALTSVSNLAIYWHLPRLEYSRHTFKADRPFKHINIRRVIMVLCWLVPLVYPWKCSKAQVM